MRHHSQSAEWTIADRDPSDSSYRTRTSVHVTVFLAIPTEDRSDGKREPTLCELIDTPRYVGRLELGLSRSVGNPASRSESLDPDEIRRAVDEAQRWMDAEVERLNATLEGGAA